MAEDEVKEKDMAKTDGITHYVCDRCGSDAYLAANSAASADWREVERFDQYGSKASRLLCKSCTDKYKQLAAQQDAAFQAFMAKKGE